jgi:hypothetical protein
MQIVNQYSMLWAGIFIVVLAAFVFLRKGIKLNNGIWLFAVLAALFASWLFLRPEKASTNELAEFQSQIGQGQAVLIEMQSPY